MNRIGLAVAAAVIFWLVPSAHAQTPVACNPSTWTRTPYALKIGVDDSSDYPLEPVRGGLPYRRYGNQQKHTRKLVANRYVNQVSFAFNTLELENGYDFFKISGAPCSGASCNSYYSLTGAPGLASRDVNYGATTAESLQSTPVRLDFNSDYSVSAKGVAIPDVAVKCMPGGIGNDLTHTLTAGDTVDGLLLGGDDIVYLSLPGGSTPGFHQTLAMWAPPGTDGDFDLLVRCGARPTASLYDFASRTNGNDEFVHFSDADRTCSSNWYVGVHAYNSSGKANRGAFHMLYSKHRTTEHLTWKVGIHPFACGGELVVADFERQNATAWLHRAAKEIFGASDGQTFIDFELYTNYSADVHDAWSPTWTCGGVACNLRLMPCTYPGGGQSSPLSQQSWLGYNVWNNGAMSGGWLLHEFGHSHYGLGDDGPGGHSGWDGYWGIEPGEGPGAILPSDYPTAERRVLYNACGHSTMSNGNQAETVHKICTAYSHLRDMRYVRKSNETDVLTTNGKFQWEAGAATSAYGSPIGVPGVATSSTPVTHSAGWTDRSDYRVAIENGTLWSEPAGSDDPYDFMSFENAAFPGRVTVH